MQKYRIFMSMKHTSRSTCSFTWKPFRSNFCRKSMVLSTPRNLFIYYAARCAWSTDVNSSIGRNISLSGFRIAAILQMKRA